MTIQTLFLAFSVFSGGVMAMYLVRHYLFTFYGLYRYFKKPDQTYPQLKPTVTVIVPAHNEEKVIGDLLHRLKKLTYPNNYDIFVVDDSSTDRTGPICDEIARSSLYPIMHVLHRKNGGSGKSGALNEALKLAQGDVLVFFDADYKPDKDIIERLLRGFGPKVAAVQGYIDVENYKSSWITKIVRLERFAGYGVNQFSRYGLGLLPQLGGTVMAIQHRALEEVGGFRVGVLAEDTDLTLQFALRGWKISYQVMARSWEEAVDTVKAYFRQRYRWARGHMQCARRYSWKVLRSAHLSTKEKLDLLLCLGIYFLPVLCGLGWIVSAAMLFIGYQLPLWNLGLLSFCVFSGIGDFAPISEVILGAAIEHSKRALLWLPLLLVTYVLSVVICTKALTDMALRKPCDWSHTKHYGEPILKIQAP